MAKVIMGVDPASFKNMGVSVLKTSRGKPVLLDRFTKVFDVDKTTKDQRFLDLEETVMGLFNKYKVTDLVFERTQFGKPFVMSQIYETIGVIKLACLRNGVSVHEISPNTIKLQVTGDGRAKKPKVISSVMDIFGLEKKQISSDHEADAIGAAFCLSKMQGEKKK